MNPSDPELPIIIQKIHTYTNQPLSDFEPAKPVTIGSDH